MKHFPMIDPRWLFTCFPRAFADCITRLGVGTMAIALLVITPISFFAPGVYAATKLYSTDFSPAQATLDVPSFTDGTTGFWRRIMGINGATGKKEYILPWNASFSYIHYNQGYPLTHANIDSYQVAEIQQVTGPNGSQVYALYQNMKQVLGRDGKYHSAQNPLTIYRGDSPSTDTGDVYYTFWMKLQPDLNTNMGTNPGVTDWRMISQFKTTEPHGISDYRINTLVSKNNSTGVLYWQVIADGVNRSLSMPYVNEPRWHVNNTTVPVPVGEWFKYEVFWHRSVDNATGSRYWVAINGQVICDYTDPVYGLMGPQHSPINRVMIIQNYSGNANSYQWTTRLEIWDGFP